MNQGELIELIIASFPFPEQITAIDLSSEISAIRFNWRGTWYRMSNSGSIEEIRAGVLIYSDKAILLDHLCKKTRILHRA